MPYFIFIGRDKPGALDARMAARPVHLEHLNGSGLVKAGGAMLDADGKPEGSVVIVETETLEAAEAFFAADPYKAADVFESTEVKPWRLAVGGFGT
jgi:uncharacterized protein YciI